MPKEKDIQTITDLAVKYQVKEIYLFGSSTLDYDKANDIDLGVKGLPPRYFFEFYGKLFKFLDKPVDLVDMDENNPFNQIILAEGTKIYG